METDLGATLLYRSPKGVMPTEAGTILLKNARIILDQFSIAEHEIKGHEDDPTGEVRLGLPGTISQILSVPLITAVRTRFPNIKLRISDAMSGFVFEWMREAIIDLAILYNEPEDNGIHGTRLLEEKLVLFGPAKDSRKLPPSGASVPFSTVADLPMILPGIGHALRDQLMRTASSSQTPLNTIIDVDSYVNIKRLVIEGLGYSILPENAVASEADDGVIRRWRFSAPGVKRSVYLWNSVERPMTNAVAAVRKQAIETLLELAREGTWIGAEIVADKEVIASNVSDMTAVG